MVSPQDTYEAGPNGNEVLRLNPGTNILTTNHIYTCNIVGIIGYENNNNCVLQLQLLIFLDYSFFC